MDTRTIYAQKLAAREAELDRFLQMEQRIKERKGRGFRHPFYTRRINKLLDMTAWLQQQIDKIDAEAGN